MDWLIDLLHNQFLLTSLSSWFVAQVMKVIINAFLNKKWDFERLFGDGGMPSGHSATVSSLAVLSALVYGTSSFQFAVTAILAIIVCHDAMGVRLETGKQAMVLNEIVKEVKVLSKQELTEVTLKEFVGHTPSQVCVGIMIGIANALFMHFIVFQLFLI